MIRRLLLPGMASLLTLASVGCHPTPVTPPPRPLPQPTTMSAETRHYTNAEAGIEFDYPAGWQPAQPGDPSVIFSVNGSGGSQLNLAYPKLPWHIPNLIPIGRVRDGYVDDIRQHHIPDAAATDESGPNIPDASTARVSLSGHSQGKSMLNHAVMIVHNDHVYIIDVHCDPADDRAAVDALNLCVSTLKWIKR